MRRLRLALAAAVPTLLAVVALPPLLSAPASAEEARPAVLHPAHVGAVNSTFPEHGQCPGDGWGWHFVVPGNGNFVTLSVTFASAGTINMSGDDFGPPDDSHAYVTTPTDDTLLAGSATITGGNKDEFNLSHTCPGTTTPSPSPSTSPSESPSPSPSTSPSESPSPSPSESVSPTPSASPSETTSPTPAPSVSATVTTRAPSTKPTVKGVKRTRTGAQTLPRTGKPILPLTLLGLFFVAAGVALVLRTSAANAAHRQH
jgi:hypothetical protein